MLLPSTARARHECRARGRGRPATVPSARATAVTISALAGGRTAEVTALGPGARNRARSAWPPSAATVLRGLAAIPGAAAFVRALALEPDGRGARAWRATTLPMCCAWSGPRRSTSSPPPRTATRRRACPATCSSRSAAPSLQRRGGGLPAPAEPSRAWTSASTRRPRAATRSAPASTSQMIDVRGRRCSELPRLRRAGLERGVERGLDATATRTLNGEAFPRSRSAQSEFFDQDFNPLVEIVRDTVGRHDAFALACTSKYPIFEHLAPLHGLAVLDEQEQRALEARLQDAAVAAPLVQRAAPCEVAARRPGRCAPTRAAHAKPGPAASRRSSRATHAACDRAGWSPGTGRGRRLPGRRRRRESACHSGGWWPPAMSP